MNDKDLPTTEYDENESGTETGAEYGSEIESETGTEIGTETVSEVASATVAESTTEAYAGDPELDAVAEAAVKEERRRRAAAAGGGMTMAKTMKFGALICVSFAVLLFASIAWFTMSRENETGGMQMDSQNNGFNIQVNSGTSGTIGYYELYRFLDRNLTGNSGTITNDFEGGQVISWRFADGDDMLMPGSQGVLEFDVLSNGGNVDNLEYQLVITGYDAARTHLEKDYTDPENPVDYEVVDELYEINSLNGYSGTRLASISYLNSHVLFFTGRNGSSEADYTYYGFINDKDSFELTLTNGIGKIYWIWPNTLGQIALDATDTNYISGTPVLYSSATSYAEDRAALKTYLKNNQADIFKGTEASYSSLVDALYNKKELDQSYKIEFDKLSEGYNSADQEIGNNIDYVLVHMIATMR